MEYNRISPSEIQIGYLVGNLEVDIMLDYISQNGCGMYQNTIEYQLPKYLFGILEVF